MLRVDLLKRLTLCMERGLCFISMQPLDCGKPVVRIYNVELGKEVRVLKQYVK